MPSVADDVERSYMMRALALAERGRGRTSPNPIVGAVVVRDGRVVGEGWHRALGLPHAEQEALARAGGRARGATLYVTLEPCAHTGRTPPCVDAVIRAGIRRCVVAVRDPHRIVNGRGLRLLRRAGVRVRVGVGAEPVRHALRGYLLAHRRGRPRVTWKIASTLDGRIADRDGRSRWITSTISRHRGHRLRAVSDAVLIGSRTARARRSAPHRPWPGRGAAAAARRLRHGARAAAHAPAVPAAARARHRGRVRRRRAGAGRARALAPRRAGVAAAARGRAGVAARARCAARARGLPRRADRGWGHARHGVAPRRARRSPGAVPGAAGDGRGRARVVRRSRRIDAGARARGDHRRAPGGAVPTSS